MRDIPVMNRAFTISLLMSLLAVSGVAQADKVDDYIKAEMQKQRIPGLSLAVIKDGQIILAKGYGFANVEHQVLVKPETIFQSGSVGKQFTATAVMILVEEGKITLDVNISKYLVDTPESWKRITVRHLLTHTAGMTDYPVVFANLAQANPEKIARGVAAIYNPELAPPPVKAIEDKEPNVTALVKELLPMLAEGTADPNLFTPEARAILFSDRAKQIHAHLKSLGAPGLVELVERKEEDGNRVYRYRITFKETILFCAVRLTKEDKIAGIQLQLE